MSPSRAALWERSHTRFALRLAAGVLVAFVAADHYYEYSVEQYSVLPTIGTLFLLNFIAATVCGLLLLAPLERVLHRVGRATWWLAAFGGFAIGTTSLIGLLVSEQTPLFGYMELNYRPAVLVGLTSEAASTVFCAGLLVLDFRGLPDSPLGWALKQSRRRPTGAPTRDDPRRDASPATEVLSS
jgi:hypothetical protein